MKTIFLKSGPWITLVLGFSSLVLLLQLNLVNRVDVFFSRQEFEEFLHCSIAGWLQQNNSEESGQQPRSDLPDQAALQDYLNTVDADEKHVPRKHPRQIYDSPRANEKKTTLKSGSNLHWQGKEANFAGRVWAGGMTRGLWYKENSTNRSPWIPLNDFWSRNCMTCDPNNRTSFFIGTGEGQTAKIIYRESSGLGCGIQRSGYAGKTCSFRPGKENFECVSDIAVRYQVGTSVLCAAVVPGIYRRPDTAP